MARSDDRSHTMLPPGSMFVWDGVQRFVVKLGDDEAHVDGQAAPRVQLHMVKGSCRIQRRMYDFYCGDDLLYDADDATR